MSRVTKTKHVYGPAPMTRTVEGLKPYKNRLTGFEHDQVETRDFKAKSYVFCKVRHGEYEFEHIFGWLHESEAWPIRGKDDKVKVVTMTAAEREEIGTHLQRAVRRTELKLHFW